MDTSKSPPFMFKSQLADYFFRWRWWTAPVVFLPLSFAVIFYLWLNLFVKAFSLLCLLALGVALWTLFEYCMHRFLFHFIGNSPSLKHFHYVVHGMHHAHPTDPVRVIFPPFGSALLGGIVLAILLLFLPIFISLNIFAGFVMGYVWYEFMHYAAHQIKWKTSYFKRLKRHHLLHHHSTSYRQKNFGVTTSLWDRAFGTYLAS